MKREEVLLAIKKAQEDPSDFLELIEKHNAKGETFDLLEFFQTLPKKQHGQLWGHLLALTEHCVRTVVEAEEEREGENEGDETTVVQVDERILSILGGVIQFCQSALSLEEPILTQSLRDTLQILHDILLNLLEPAPELQNKVSLLCEKWWCEDREDRDGLVPHSLLYVVARSLTDGATLSDVKRVWMMRQAFLLLDFEDPSSNPFKSMLLSCTLQPLYLNSEEGRKLLSFLFGMHPKFVEDLHQTIKNQIPHSPKSFLEVYGEVYFRAWRLASGPYLKQIEEFCLQDLMYCAVHASRHGLHSLFHSLRKLLGYIHLQRTQKGVSEMLLRLYNPFLWRSLKVASPQVRTNAATLFLDVFPLQDPDSTRQEIDTVMQKQFDAMMDLLRDASIQVRVTAVAGVCRVLSFYWEMVPAPVIKSLLGILVKELAWDSSSINVRVAVFQGLCVILENRLSHPLMHDLLPLLQNHLHDTSEKVRIAFLDMLLLVKGMRMVKFWHICSLEHLLARVEVDSVHVVKRIVALLIDSFQPGNVSPSQQIERCITLLRTNSEAARRFYQLAVGHLSVAEVVKFILAIQLAIVHCVEEEGDSSEVEVDQENDPSLIQSISDDNPTGIAKGGWKEAKPDEKNQLSRDIENESGTSESLSLSDTDILCGLLETMVILWESARDKLNKSGNKAIRNKLYSKVAENLPLFFNTFKDGPSRSALYLLASYLPKKSVTDISKGTLQALSSLRHPTKSQDYTSLLVALVSWKETKSVVKLAKQWLAPVLIDSQRQTLSDENAEPCVTGKNHTKRKNKRGKTTSNCTIPGSPPQPLLAIELVNWMLSHPLCLQELVEMEEFWELSEMLKHSMELLELQYLVSTAPSNSPVSFEVLSSSLSLYTRLCMHRNSSAGENESQQTKFDEKIQEILVWCDRVLLPALNDQITSDTATQRVRHSSRKRKANQAHPPPPPPTPPVVTHARLLAEKFLWLFSEMVMTGLTNNGDLEIPLAQFAASAASTSSGPSLLSGLCKLLYQLCEVSSKCQVDGIRSGSGSLKPSAILLRAVLSLMLTLSETNPEDFTKSWSQVRQCISAVVAKSIRTTSLSLSSETLDTYTAIVENILQSQTQHIKLHPTLEAPTSLDDLPLFTCSVLKPLYKDSQSTRLLVEHMHTHLSECDPVGFPDILLTHQSSLHILSVLATNSKNAGDAMMYCIRDSLRFVGSIPEEEAKRWNAPLSEVNGLLESVQERLFH